MNTTMEQINGGYYQEVWNWAKENKQTVRELSQKYSGSFVKALTVAFVVADPENTAKVLRGWHKYFIELYEHHKREEQKIKREEVREEEKEEGQG